MTARNWRRWRVNEDIEAFLSWQRRVILSRGRRSDFKGYSKLKQDNGKAIWIRQTLFGFRSTCYRLSIASIIPSASPLSGEVQTLMSLKPTECRSSNHCLRDRSFPAMMDIIFMSPAAREEGQPMSGKMDSSSRIFE